MPAHFAIVTGPHGPHLRVDGGNGEPVASTQVYDDDRSPAQAIAVICAAVDALRGGARVVIDETHGPRSSDLLQAELARVIEDQVRAGRDRDAAECGS